MELETILLSKHSKSTTSKVITWINNDPTKFKALMQCVLGNDVILAQRAAWAMSYIIIEQPKLIYPFLNKLFYMHKPKCIPPSKEILFVF